ncbi:putative serine/threonine-protein kinase PBL19 [Camellia lanceoleosa]|uniref:Serine/threonine-protein kinase PBL19 n=1 Tax=Camellia lanceoleosa TaxID=1840588 RepID=A0ACC0FAA5_9ERIC|nr:putative serine/threonine-protein kinase PBL19 [Camellia lanceoleosa]
MNDGDNDGGTVTMMVERSRTVDGNRWPGVARESSSGDPRCFERTTTTTRCSSCTQEYNLHRPMILDEATDFFNKHGISDFTFDTCRLDRTRIREQRSTPILKIWSKSKSNSSAADSVSKTSCSANSPSRIPKLYEEKAQNLIAFSFSELRQATNGFNRLLKIGEGGFRSVFKGSIKAADGKGDPIVVAIKMLDRNGFQGHKQWIAEVQFLGVVDHPNLVKLIGYCAGDGERGIQWLLVYEFMPNKILEDHLFNRAFPALTWKTRLQIILGAAQGLAYLHEELEVQRDFQSSNVLLDEHFKPKLSDFGLAREGPTDGHTHVSTAVGTSDILLKFLKFRKMAGKIGKLKTGFQQDGNLVVIEIVLIEGKALPCVFYCHGNRLSVLILPVDAGQMPVKRL